MGERVGKQPEDVVPEYLHQPLQDGTSICALTACILLPAGQSGYTGRPVVPE